MKPVRKKLFTLAAVVLITAAWIYPGELNFSGYYKSFLNLMIPGSIGVEGGGKMDLPDLGMFTSKLRMKLFYRAADWLNFRAEYELTPTILDMDDLSSLSFFDGVASPSYRIIDLPDHFYPRKSDPRGNFHINQNLDRFFATLSFDFADIYIGRQVISWGSAYVINPTDVISPFNFNEIDKEEKSGVDAVRVRIPLGTMNELDAGYVFGDPPGLDGAAFFLRGKFNLLRSDISLMVLGFRRNLLLGFDLSGSLGGAGVRLEVAYILDKAWDNSYPDDVKKNYTRLSLGADYNFSDALYGYIEYHLNSPGSGDTGDYTDLSTTNPYSEGSVYLMGKQYLSAGFTWQLHPLLPVNGFVIYNISDGSMIFSPSAEYNIKEDIYLSLGAFFGVGKGTLISQAGILGMRSEFGTYPQMIYTSFRIYF